MAYRKLKNAIISLAIILSAILIVIIFNVATEQSSLRMPDPARGNSSEDFLNLQELYTTYHSGADLTYKIKADYLKVPPRKFSIFKIKIYDQAHLKNVHIEAYLTSVRERLELFQEDTLSAVNSSICDGFQLDIYRNGEHIFNVSAEQAKTNFLRRKTTLLKAVITHIPTNEKIAGHSVVWDELVQRFIIPGPFLKQTTSGSKKGKGIKIDLYNHQTLN